MERGGGRARERVDVRVRRRDEVETPFYLPRVYACDINVQLELDGDKICG